MAGKCFLIKVPDDTVICEPEFLLELIHLIQFPRCDFVFYAEIQDSHQNGGKMRFAKKWQVTPYIVLYTLCVKMATKTFMMATHSV